MLDTFKVGELVPWWKESHCNYMYNQSLQSSESIILGIFAQIIMILEKGHCIAIG